MPPKPPHNDPDTLAFLRDFYPTPKLLAGQCVDVIFSIVGLSPTNPSHCNALGLVAGETVEDLVKLSAEDWVVVYASGNIASDLRRVPERDADSCASRHHLRRGPDRNVDRIKVEQVKECPAGTPTLR